MSWPDCAVLATGSRASRPRYSSYVIGVDFVTLAHEQLPLAFSVRPETRFFPGPPIREIVNVRSGLGYACVMRGYGVIEGYEPMLGYRRNAPTLRRPREHPDYQGESWTARGRVEPVYWSPNRMVFQVDPGEEVFINQNPGSWWWINGRRAFAGLRCAELMVPFAAKADATGRLELRIIPRSGGSESACRLPAASCWPRRGGFAGVDSYRPQKYCYA